MKHLTTALITLGFMAASYAHDEGHGPKLSDTGKYGGLVSGVVMRSDAKLGAKAALVHKSELVRTGDGTVRLYVYDQKMSPLDLKIFDAKAKAVLATKVKGKWQDTSFDLEVKDNSFAGKMPKPQSKPYNIDVTLKQGDKELLTAFDNLD